MSELNAITAIAYRDLMKFVRDPARIVVFGFAAGVPLSVEQLAKLVPVAIAVCLFGGAFGILVLSNLSSQRAANQIFPFIMLPQLFIAGVFAPLRNLPWFLSVLSLI